jgi:hypothetical protein
MGLSEEHNYIGQHSHSKWNFYEKVANTEMYFYKNVIEKTEMSLKLKHHYNPNDIKT